MKVYLICYNDIPPMDVPLWLNCGNSICCFSGLVLPTWAKSFVQNLRLLDYIEFVDYLISGECSWKRNKKQLKEKKKKKNSEMKKQF